MNEIKQELKFGVNNFGNQDKMSLADTVIQMLINLLMLKPGQLPSLPHIGINIHQYLYNTEDDINSSVIKNKILEQCPEIFNYIDSNSLEILIVPYNNESYLYIHTSFTDTIDSNMSADIGMKKNSYGDDITFNYNITDSTFINN